MNRFSDLWTIKMSDWQRGLVVAVFTAPLTIIYQSVTTTPITLVFDWKAILGAAVAGGLGYILKNFTTGAGGQLLTNKTPLQSAVATEEEAAKAVAVEEKKKP